ncbi:MAG TPA: universal stress protein [Gammaproteobacteria bacterium]|nr:universal stress protein [Gammaproteobacteria bacterium]
MTARSRYMVLVPSSLERSPALFRAMALAKESEAKLLLASFEYDGALAKLQAKGFDLAAYLEGRKHELERFAAHLRREGFAVEAAVHWGRPLTDLLLAEVEKLAPDMVIKDVHVEPTVRRLLLTGQDYELLRRCPAPLMLVRQGAPNLPTRMLAAVDPLDENFRPHELNAQILGAAEKYGMLCGASVDVVNVLEPVPLKAGSAYGFLIEEYRRNHEWALRELGNEYGIEERHLHLLAGFPVDALASFIATQRIDLLIMGTVSRSRLERLEMGSVAEKLFARLDCDVLAVKVPGTVT